MKDFLKDLIDHTHGLGVVELLKVSGTDQETTFNAVAENKTVIISGSYKNPIADFVGTFGMPNLGKLKTILGFDLYDENAVISVTKQNRDGVDVPTTIHFQTQNNDFVNDYRLMSKAIVEEKVKSVSFKGAQWGVEFEPTIAGIQKLKKQAQANSEEEHFVMKTDGTDLKIYFGDPSTHSGNFVFQAGVTGSVTGKNFSWPVKEFISIMDLVGDKTIRVSDAGATEIVVDSGIATYRYLLPANVK
jgi:hypothetical protein